MGPNRVAFAAISTETPRVHPLLHSVALRMTTFPVTLATVAIALSVPAFAFPEPTAPPRVEPSPRSVLTDLADDARRLPSSFRRIP
jgi:hypothetical protein